MSTYTARIQSDGRLKPQKSPAFGATYAVVRVQGIG